MAEFYLHQLLDSNRMQKLLFLPRFPWFLLAEMICIRRSRCNSLVQAGNELVVIKVQIESARTQKSLLGDCVCHRAIWLIVLVIGDYGPRPNHRRRLRWTTISFRGYRSN